MLTPTDLPGTRSSPRTVLDALGRHGVLVFRDLHLEPEAQVEFCQPARARSTAPPPTTRSQA